MASKVKVEGSRKNELFLRTRRLKSIFVRCGGVLTCVVLSFFAFSRFAIAEPTPTQCVPTLFRMAAAIVRNGVILGERLDPPELNKGLKNAFQLKYRQLVFEKMAGEDQAALNAAWERPTSKDEMAELGVTCVDLYNGLRRGGRIDLREENVAVQKADYWLHEMVRTDVEIVKQIARQKAEEEKTPKGAQR
jgi:hypothetical protein